MKKLFKEFKEFISRGNVIDLAIGVVIGGAFTGIVNAIANDILTPLISLLTGGLDFSSLTIPLGTYENAPVINYGSFISAIIKFLLIAIAVFMIIKVLNKLNLKKEAEKPIPLETKDCPYCLSKVPKLATRCPNCTSELEIEVAEE